MKGSSPNRVSRNVNRGRGSTLIQRSKRFGGIMLLATVSASATTLWAADDTTPAAAEKDTLVTEFRGRPPFKRQLVSSEEIAELARFEEEETVSEPTTENVRVADFSGRPPFKREILSSEEVAELARFEETSSSEADERRPRRGPPGKLNSRR